ncbi:MAG: hypothetical protein QXU13_06465 [Desulfurococcaceae archaeon]
MAHASFQFKQAFLRKKYLLVMIIAICLAVVVSALSTIIWRVDIRGRVKVSSLEFSISQPAGSVVYIVHDVWIPARMKVRAVVIPREVIGEFSIAISMVLKLKGQREYVINMPCVFQRGDATCYRILQGVNCCGVMAIIPGYDQPLDVEPGLYTAELEISWQDAKGEGEFHLELYLQREE